MKFVLLLSFLFPVAFDACLASSFNQSQTSIHESENCDSSEADDHDQCGHCQVCHQVVIPRSLGFAFYGSVLSTEIPYQFYIPSADVESLKRPPKV